MSTKLALVVDDSRMARYVLGKMLTEHGIEVESVESGEEALGYLCGKKPNMIFMDHTMPGMDGFQCLRAIKNDPHTAMIPIIMYTSKEGEVYESQARALGAVDILPKNLKPLTLAKVLERQNLLPSQGGSPLDPRHAANDLIIVDQEPDEIPAEVVESSQSHPELEALEKRVEELTSQLSSLSTTSKPKARPIKTVHFAMVLGAMVIVWLLITNNKLITEVTILENEKQSIEDTVLLLNRQNLEMRNKLEDRLDDELSRTDLLTQRVYDSIEWALNQEGTFPWNSPPFSDRLAPKLAKLADDLYEMGFVGVINVRSHLGQFCTQTDGNGQSMLPAAGQLISSCEITQFTASYAESTGMEQSQEFTNALDSIQDKYGNDIKVQLSTAGTRRPLMPYPSQEPDTLAETWNEIAASNQRIEISINPF